MSLQEIKDRMGKFSFAQLTANENGKTSASATNGSLVIVTGCFVLIVGAFTKDATTLACGTGTIATGASVLLGRKIVEGKSTDATTALTNIV